LQQIISVFTDAWLQAVALHMFANTSLRVSSGS